MPIDPDNPTTQSQQPSRQHQNRGRDRASRRGRAHDDAHALAEQTPAPVIPEHELIPQNHPQPITTTEELHEIIERVREHGSFAYDTEFIGESSYFPHLCLIQIATTDEVTLIDPLSGLDVRPIWELIADPEIETIVHAGAQDLEPVVRHLNRSPANIFDTQIATGFLRQTYPMGLHRLVEEYAQVKLGKAMTFTQWDRRPLSKVHGEYAADDVRYLLLVRETLRRELNEYGHEAWVAEECAALSNMAKHQFNPEAICARLISSRSFKPRMRAILRNLVVVRNEIARRQDLPPRTVLRDDVLVRLTRNPPTTKEALMAVKGFPRPLAEQEGQLFLNAIADARQIPQNQLPRSTCPDESNSDRVRIDSLWALVCAFCHGKAISPLLCANRAEIAQYYFAATGRDVDPPTRLINGWRGEVIGSMLKRMLCGTESIRLNWDSSGLHATPIADSPPSAGFSESSTND